MNSSSSVKRLPSNINTALILNTNIKTFPLLNIIPGVEGVRKRNNDYHNDAVYDEAVSQKLRRINYYMVYRVFNLMLAIQFRISTASETMLSKPSCK